MYVTYSVHIGRNGSSHDITQAVIVSLFCNCSVIILPILLFLFQVTLPVYLTQTRAKLLFTADFKAEGANFYERGVAIICSSL